MTFPTINFKTNNAPDIYDGLKELVTHKLETLEKFIKDAPIVCEVEFEKETAQQSGSIYRVEVNLKVDGQLFRAEATEDSYEKAIDEVRDELDKELRRAGSKKETLFKRGSRKLKDMLRFGGQ